MNFPHLASLQRKAQVGARYEFAANGTSVCFLQPLDDEASAIYGITFGKGWKCYFPFASTILEGDRVSVDGVTYGVRGVKAYSYGLKHKRASLEEL